MKLIRFRGGRAVLGKNAAVYLMLRKFRREQARQRLLRMRAARLNQKWRKPMHYEYINPADHATSMIESCQGDVHEALAMARTNIEFACTDDGRDYWARVAAAIERTTRGEPLLAAVFVDDFGQVLRETAITPEEVEMANAMLRSIGSGRRWMLRGASA
jgi:hypothetical protein